VDHVKTYSELNAIVGIFVLNDSPHLETPLESAGHVISNLARFDRTLDARADPIFAQDTEEIPAAGWDAGDLCNWFHFLHATNADLGDPESTADMCPHFTRFRGLHRASLVGTQLALWRNVERTSPAQPRAGGDGSDAVACLMHTNVALVTEYHFVALFTVGLQKIEIFKYAFKIIHLKVADFGMQNFEKLKNSYYRSAHITDHTVILVLLGLVVAQGDVNLFPALLFKVLDSTLHF
jgi:hypothetical protein